MSPISLANEIAMVPAISASVMYEELPPTAAGFSYTVHFRSPVYTASATGPPALQKKAAKTAAAVALLQRLAIDNNWPYRYDLSPRLGDALRQYAPDNMFAYYSNNG